MPANDVKNYMTNKVKAYIASFRLRTLPLSVAGILSGTLLACADGEFHALRFVLAIVTVLSLQILSNVANELGDTLRGTDTEDRRGISYPLQSGALSAADLRRTILRLVIISAASGVALVASSFDALFSREGIAMLVLGGCAILAALGYTLGRHPYGYMGLGDPFVFLFFGLLSTAGAYFLMTGRIGADIALPASACGLLSVGVLNINNMRDADTDRKTRITIPILLGERRSKIYQTLLETLPFAALAAYCVIRGSRWPAYLFLLFVPLFSVHIYGVWQSTGRQLDRRLPELSVLTLALCICFGVLQAV